MTRRLIAEAIGALLLAAAVIGSGIMAERLADGNSAIALLANTGATVAILAVLIAVLGPVSGAHFNSQGVHWDSLWHDLCCRMRPTPGVEWHNTSAPGHYSCFSAFASADRAGIASRKRLAAQFCDVQERLNCVRQGSLPKRVIVIAGAESVRRQGRPHTVSVGSHHSVRRADRSQLSDER